MAEPLDIGNAASLARTALTDPAAVPDADILLDADAMSYAVDRMDEICNAISPPIEDRASIAAGVRAVGLALAQLQYLARACGADEPGAPHALPYAKASVELMFALEHIDLAWLALEPAHLETEDVDPHCSGCDHPKRFHDEETAIRRACSFPSPVGCACKGFSSAKPGASDPGAVV